MLNRFVYLDEPTLAGYSAQVDGGLIAQTKFRTVNKGSVGAEVKALALSAKVGHEREKEQEQTLSYPSEAQFQRLLVVAANEPEEIAWTDVMNPDDDFAQTQVGEIVAWECDIDLAPASRMAARGGSDAQALSIIGSMLDAGALGLLGGQANTPEQSARLKQQLGAARDLLESMDIKRVAIGKDEASGWTLYGTLFPEHFRVENIEDERLIFVGKVKKIVPANETRHVVNTVALRLLQQMQQGAGPVYADEVEGPALDILAIYR